MLIWAAHAGAFSPKGLVDQLDLLVFESPELRIVETPTGVESIRDQVPNIAAMDAFRAAHGNDWRFTLDQRRGVPALLSGGAIPFIPGPANGLEWEAFAAGCENIQCLDDATVETLARAFLVSNRQSFKIDPAQLTADPDGTIALGRSIYLIRFQWQVDGIPVDGGSVFLRINNGNLIQVATEKIGPLTLDTSPSLSPAAAHAILDEFLGDQASAEDQMVDKGTLLIVPVTPAGQDTENFAGAIGSGISYRLAYRLAFQRPQVVGTWEVLIDAHSGEILRFVDSNRYGRVHGGAYPGDNHTGEADRPLAFADTGLAAPNQYADAGGLFPGDTATTTLRGKYTWVNDSCGAISNTTSDGDVDFSLGSGTDCAVPNPNSGGAGNTHSARTQYYHLTAINIKARTYMPTNTWLTTDHMNVNTNQSPWCNATSGGGTLDFYQAASGCWNLGELPGVALHEWGHSMDDFDGSGGNSPPVETRADWTAILQTHDSCVGRGFFLSSNCSGYGDPCTDCSGVRECDYTKLTNNTPWTPANHGTFWDCGGPGGYNGPCNLEDHCESGLSTQALWELVNVDLQGPPSNLDAASAWILVDRLFYQAMPTLGNLYTCTLPSSNGCNGGSLYTTMMALDDEGDGTANGTPHAAAIFAALDRHNIACGAAGDPQNQNSSSCPSLAPPFFTVSPGSDSALLNWNAPANATRYFVFRNEIDCDSGFTKVAEIAAPTTTYTDTTVVNGIEYFYRMQAATASDSCTSAVSVCQSATPEPCAGALGLERGTFNCDDVISINLIDSDLAGAGSQTVTVWSTSETTPETIALTEDPPSSGRFSGTIATTTSTSSGDLMVGVVNGDTVTIRYHDASYCGSPLDVDQTATVDCVGPDLTAVAAVNVGGFSADIVWNTAEAADSLVVYEDSIPPAASSQFDGSFVTDHLLRISSLAECTEYAFYVTSVDSAGNSATNDNNGSYFTFETGLNTQPSYLATDTPVPIIDFQTATSTIAVTDAKAVLDVNVTLNITHTFDGDLGISLLGPNAVEISLVDHRGSWGANFVNTVLDDEASTAIADGSPPFTGSFRPEQPLSAFDGIQAAGNWTLKVADDGWFDTGAIDSWTIELTYPAAICDETIFENGLESGDTSLWSLTVQ